MCESLQHDSTTKADFWKQVVDGSQRSYLMSCSVNNSLSAEVKQGLTYHHAYALLSARNEKDKDGNHLKLLEVRNPWGSGEWTGDWGDDSDLWYPELKERLHSVEREDGTFFICLDDFFVQFSSSTICYEHGGFSKQHSMAHLEHDFLDLPSRDGETAME
jgi:calpain-15